MAEGCHENPEAKRNKHTGDHRPHSIHPLPSLCAHLPLSFLGPNKRRWCNGSSARHASQWPNFGRRLIRPLWSSYNLSNGNTTGHFHCPSHWLMAPCNLIYIYIYIYMYIYIYIYILYLICVVHLLSNSIMLTCNRCI